MDTYKRSFLQLLLPVLLCLIISCNSGGKKNADKQIVADPDRMDEVVSGHIKDALQVAEEEKKIDDSITVRLFNVVSSFYNGNDYVPVWSSREKWEPLADSLYSFIRDAEQYGLFPKDYHFASLQSLKQKLDTDSLKRMDAVLWSRADILFTDGFMRLIRDLKQGRLQPDSLSLNKDSAIAVNFFVNSLKELAEKKQFSALIRSVQPVHKGYWELQKGIRSFLDSMDRKPYTYVSYPYKKGDAKDSAYFVKMLQKRLNESACIDFTDHMPDTTQLSNAIKKYQGRKGIKADGKVSTALVRLLNTNDIERFNRIAITMDKYKQMPPKMPEQYIWVNIPGYYLWVINHDTVALESKTIIGKPETRTPLLTSEISDMITYPTWTVPTSIIAKQYLPKLKNNPNYLARLGLRLVNAKGETISGGSVDWGRYSKGIPYKVVQGSGDNNSLGVMKFNFNNPYAVYLHDTNQRYLFKNAMRALSHGCVRVQEWEKLAFYIARNDSLNSRQPDSLKYNTDSIRNWIAAKERRRIDVKSHIPLFIRYFTCEGKEGKVKFYDDIYSEDKILRDKYFANK
jgi:murein L,D-transpeptidase YcbB/YkuD